MSGVRGSIEHVFDTMTTGDPGDDLAAAAVATLASTSAVRAAADAVELRAIATLVQVRRGQAITDCRRGAEDRRGADGRHVRARQVDLELVDRCTANEVSVALWLSPVVARDRLELARELVQRRPATFDALRTGAVDLVRARRICDAVRGLPPDDPGRDGSRVADAVEAEVLSPGSVPLLADLRPARPAGQLTPAQLTARLGRLVLKADPAGAVDRTAVADQRRGCSLRALPDGMALLSVTARAELLTAAVTRVDTTARALLAADATAGGGQRARPPSGPGPTSGVDASRSLDQARVDVLLASLLGHSADLGATNVQVSLALVAPAGTVLAGGDEGGELVGYGPVPAPLVRELAGDASWTRWVSDPATGQVTDVQRRRYRPSAAVAALVRARDLQCRFPTCRRSARVCDIDHVVAFPAGDTHPENLATECRQHHLVKHRGGFAVSIEPDGSTTWTTPTGQRVTTHPPSWGRPPPVGTLRSVDASPRAVTPRSVDALPRADPPPGPDTPPF